ncbi:MAG: SDR family oxidoreductase [Blastocatellia bacterium]|nr:SDR family oxidoreductase [Blastocatellia bacterium]
MKAYDLSDKRILITGGSTGIGRAAVEMCAQAGAKVVFCSRTQTDLDQTLTELHHQGLTDVRAVAADVSQEADVERVLDAVETEFGPVNAVIHAAAVLSPIGNILEIEPADWKRNIEINLFGTFLVTRQSCLRMRQKWRGGRIVLFSGGGASFPFPDYTSYACSKVAVVRFAETVAEEMKPYNIEINCVAPGFVATRMHRETLAAEGRVNPAYLEKTKAQLAEGGVPAEVGASAAAFLISEQARGISGKFVAAVHDKWSDWPQFVEVLQTTDVFTLRRILPAERGIEGLA